MSIYITLQRVLSVTMYTFTFINKQEKVRLYKNIKTMFFKGLCIWLCVYWVFSFILSLLLSVSIYNVHSGIFLVA